MASTAEPSDSDPMYFSDAMQWVRSTCAIILVVSLASCASKSGSPKAADGGAEAQAPILDAPGTGGALGTGGVVGTGGAPAAADASALDGDIVADASPATGGQVGTGGTVATGGSGGTITIDAKVADAAIACPQTPPENGAPCPVDGLCYYEDCGQDSGSGGRTEAVCTDGQWTVRTGVCDYTWCQIPNVGTQRSCPSGQVCLLHAGGSVNARCIPNPCGTGPASADCTPLTSGCTPVFNLVDGLTYYCNDCPPSCE